MSWLESMFQVGVPMLSGHLQGQAQGQQLAYERERDEEERKRKLEMDALQRQLMQAQIAKANAPAPTPWQASGFGTQGEQLSYLGELEKIRNPAKPVQTPWQEEGFSDEGSYLGYLEREGRAKKPPAQQQTPWEEAGFSDQESYLAYLERQGKAQYPERYDGAGAGAGTPDQRNKFVWEYMLKTNEGRMDPLTFEYQPPLPPEERIKAGIKAWEELQQLTDPNYNPYDDLPALPEEGGAKDTTFTIEGLLRRSGLLKDEPIGPVASPQEAPDAVPMPAPPPRPAQPVAEPQPSRRQPGMSVGARIEQLKAQGVSKEEGFRILQAEGYLDASGAVIGDQ